MTVNELDRRVRPFDPVIRFFKAPEWGLVAAILAVLVLIYFLDRDHAFFQAYSLQTLLHRVARFGVLAVGAAVVIIAGGIDLSTGAVVVAGLGRQRQAADGMAAPRTAGRAGRLRSGSSALAIGLTLLDGAGDRLVPRRHDQPAAAAAVHRDAGDDGRPAQPGDHPLPEPDDQRSPVLHCVPASLGRTEVSLGHAGDLRVRRRGPERGDGSHGAGPASVRPGRQRDGRRLSGLRTQAAEGGRVRDLRAPSRRWAAILFTGSSGQADSRLRHDLRADGDHGGGRRRLQPLGGRRLDPRHGAGLALPRSSSRGRGSWSRGVDSTQIEGLVLGTVVLLAVAFNQRFRRRTGLDRCVSETVVHEADLGLTS